MATNVMATNVMATNDYIKKERKVRSNVKRAPNPTDAQKKGQFFTIDEKFHDQMFRFIHNWSSSTCILEPSVGRGDLVSAMLRRFDSGLGHLTSPDFCMYEIDPTIPPLPDICDRGLDICYADFLDENTCQHRLYHTIIGNPPYVRIGRKNKHDNKNTATYTDTNLYILFIRKCLTLLEPGGELIFIVPSDFFKRKWSSLLLMDMWENGRFTHIYHPHNDRLFATAGIDTLLFRYELGAETPSSSENIIYNDTLMVARFFSGMVTFSPNIEMAVTCDHVLVSDFSVHVGMASGRECVLQNDEHGLMTLLNGENKRNRYIFIDPLVALSTDEPLVGWADLLSTPIPVQRYMQEHKDQLISRKFRRFGEHNWFEWGASRNYNIVVNHFGKPCIYLYTMRRKILVAFAGTVEFFGAPLLLLLPDPNCTIEAIHKTVSYLNSEYFRNQFTSAGRFSTTQGQMQAFIAAHQRCK